MVPGTVEPAFYQLPLRRLRAREHGTVLADSGRVATPPAQELRHGFSTRTTQNSNEAGTYRVVLTALQRPRIALAKAGMNALPDEDWPPFQKQPRLLDIA